MSLEIDESEFWKGLNNPPRKAQNADKPGNYELAIKVLNPIVNPGDIINLEIFFTGYGDIDGVKMAFFPPTNFVEECENSIVKTGLKGEKEINNRIKLLFGHQSESIEEWGFIVKIYGAISEKWKNSTMFIDRDLFDMTKEQDPVKSLITEVPLNQAPFVVSIKTKKKVRPGIHTLRFFLTYFNGMEWKTSNDSVDIEIPTFYKRHEFMFWVIGAILALMSLSPLILNFLKMVFKIFDINIPI